MSSNTFEGPTIVLHRPLIPQNTGNIARLCVALNSPLIITGKAGFRWDEAAVRRAGLDCWPFLQFQHFPRFADFWRTYRNRRIIAVSKAGAISALSFNFEKGDIVLFGNETMGLPPVLLRKLPTSVYLPMSGPVRSLNLSNSVAVVAYCYVRAVWGDKAVHSPHDYPRTYYRRHAPKNS
ncbi:MAG: tRNA (cytidine(34)-2'-O)-methyltransferase [Turneriella sp.]|nr:tRNA (cytidine(34)-2'-O)-methyltransferase [Leptospiraceae bacterium]MCX7632714.1 tRNA (cytidine(34)-2'-O)-methyltransferase [Turneriella sp.]